MPRPWAPRFRRRCPSPITECASSSSRCPTPRSSCSSRSAPNSPIAAFLARNPAGGIHHICYEVEDIRAARDRLKASGARVLGDGEPRTGAHGKPVLFLHPKDFLGSLIELEQA